MWILMRIKQGIVLIKINKQPQLTSFNFLLFCSADLGKLQKFSPLPRHGIVSGEHAHGEQKKYEETSCEDSKLIKLFHSSFRNSLSRVCVRMMMMMIRRWEAQSVIQCLRICYKFKAKLSFYKTLYLLLLFGAYA